MKRYQLNSVALLALTLASCSNPEAESNALFVRASSEIQAASNGLGAVERFKAISKAVATVDEITKSYPQTSAAVKIASGDKIGTMTRAEMTTERQRLLAAPEVCLSVKTRDCALRVISSLSTTSITEFRALPTLARNADQNTQSIRFMQAKELRQGLADTLLILLRSLNDNKKSSAYELVFGSHMEKDGLFWPSPEFGYERPIAYERDRVGDIINYATTIAIHGIDMGNFIDGMLLTYIQEGNIININEIMSFAPNNKIREKLIKIYKADSYSGRKGPEFDALFEASWGSSSGQARTNLILKRINAVGSSIIFDHIKNSDQHSSQIQYLLNSAISSKNKNITASDRIAFTTILDEEYQKARMYGYIAKTYMLSDPKAASIAFREATKSPKNELSALESEVILMALSAKLNESSWRSSIQRYVLNEPDAIKANSYCSQLAYFGDDIPVSLEAMVSLFNACAPRVKDVAHKDSAELTMASILARITDRSSRQKALEIEAPFKATAGWPQGLLKEELTQAVIRKLRAGGEKGKDGFIQAWAALSDDERQRFVAEYNFFDENRSSKDMGWIAEQLNENYPAGWLDSMAGLWPKAALKIPAKTIDALIAKSPTNDDDFDLLVAVRAEQKPQISSELGLSILNRRASSPRLAFRWAAMMRAGFFGNE